LRNELAQPPPTLTRSTTTYHLKPQIKTQPDPAFYACPQQEAARLGIILEELAAIGEDSIREQAKWIVKDKAKWRERKEMRWRDEVREVREDRERGERENRKGAEEAERQEQDKTTQEDTTTARPQFAPPPPVHPESAAAQLGLTPEEAQAVHEECIRAQEEIQREIEEEDQVWRKCRAQQDAQDAHQPTPHAYETLYKPPQATTSLDSGLINHRDPPDHTGRYQLPTPIAHPELEQDAYDHYQTATSYDNDNDVVPNRRERPPSGYHPQPPTPTLDAQPPLQPHDHDRYYPTSDHNPYTTSFEYHEYEGGNVPMESNRDVAIEQLAHDLFASGNTGVNWAEEMDNTRLQGEYNIPTSYSPPPHIDTPNYNLKRSDSPNWREAHPERPISFRSPSPLPPKSPTPSSTPTRTPKRPQTPPAQTPESQLSGELNTLIKNTAEALRAIIRVSEKLVRQVNAGRRLAHRSKQSTGSLCEDAHGNVVCSLPPTFPSGRGVSVTGSPGASEAIA
jgi:hypothetical protein